MKKILTLLFISLINMEVWASTTLFSTNFSTADGWSSEDIITSSVTSNTKTIKGTTISFKGYKTSNVSVSASASSGTLTFTSNNLSASAGDATDANYYMAIPVSGIVAGRVTVSFTTSSAYKPYYTYDDGNSGSVVARTQAAVNNTFTITGLENDEVTIYLGTSGKTMTSLTITTPELIDLTSSTFYQTYASSNKTYAQLISAADLPSYITTNISDVSNSSGCSSSVSTPHDFSSLGSGTTYYRLKTANSINITIEALSHVKSIRLYGNGNGGSRTVTTTVTKRSGTGTAMSISSMSMANSKNTVVEYTTGDLTQKSGYDENTYYTYTISFSAACDIWGIYIEHVPSVSCSGTPSISSDLSTDKVVYCSGSIPSLSITASNADTYQWQVSTTSSSEGFANVSTGTGGTTASYTPASISEGTDYWFKCIATCSASSNSTTSAVAQLYGGTTPTTAFANGAYSVGGSDLDLSSLISSDQGSGTISYSVKNANGTGATIDGSDFSATSAGTASVTATKAANGDYCSKTIDASITVTAACSPSISDSPSSANYCKDDDATALSFTGSGHNAQKWQYYDGDSWEDIDGATNATYTPSTSATGSTQYRVVTTCDSYTTTATSSAATVTVKTLPNLTITLK